jgi:hypothetical protein
MVGFLAGIVVFITSMKDSYWMRVFELHGGRADYLFIYFTSIVFLFVTHTLSIAAISNYLVFKIMLASMLVNIFHVIWISISTYCITSSIKNKSVIDSEC